MFVGLGQLDQICLGVNWSAWSGDRSSFVDSGEDSIGLPQILGVSQLFQDVSRQTDFS